MSASIGHNLRLKSVPKHKALYCIFYSHRILDDKAFYALADRVHTEGVKLQSLEDLTALIETKQKVRENQSE